MFLYFDFFDQKKLILNYGFTCQKTTIKRNYDNVNFFLVMAKRPNIVWLLDIWSIDDLIKNFYTCSHKI